MNASSLPLAPVEPTGATVLVVDDEALFRNSAVEILRQRCPSYKVFEAADGRQALDILERVPVHVVVTDIEMPKMDGISLMLELRRRQFRGALLVVTAFGNRRIERKADVVGAFCYLEKPVDLSEMVETVRSAVDGERSEIQGVSLSGFAQLLEIERKTGRLRVSGRGEVGDLVFRDGLLVDARFRDLQGNDAAMTIFSWGDESRLDLYVGYKARRETVTDSLNLLLLEAMRRRDEEDNSGETGTSVADPEKERKETMSDLNTSLKEIMRLDGAIGVALVDHKSGMSLGHIGGGDELNLEVAAAGNTAVVRSKMQVMADLGLKDAIEDILITLGTQYHIIRPMKEAPNLFLYVALDRNRSNLAMARHKLGTVEKGLTL